MNRARLFVSASDRAKRFAAPVPGVFPLAAEVAAMLPMPVAEYWIQQRIGDGVWTLKCRYGQDADLAVARVKWWNRLLRGRRSYRMVAVLGDSVAVLFGEGARDA